VPARRRRHAGTRWWVEQRSSPPLLRPQDLDLGDVGLRHGQSRNESVPVENAHHLEADSPRGLAGKPRGGTGRACVANRQGVTTAGVVLARGRWGGSLSPIREPPCPNVTGWPRCRRRLSASGGSGEIPLDPALLDDRVPGHRPTTAPRREAAPEQHRGEQSKQASNHQDDPNRIELVRAPSPLSDLVGGAGLNTSRRPPLDGRSPVPHLPADL
jgi:hypothetical protein